MIAIVSSVIANKPCNGGNAWVVLNWVRGLRKLGLQVYFVEQIDRGSCIDSTGATTSFEDSVNRKYFESVAGQFGLLDSSALIYGDGDKTFGLPMVEMADLAGDAELLVNISGHLTLESIKSRPRRKVYLDLDPGFTQFWQATGTPGARLEGHDFYFTVGENIGHAGCAIPTGGIEWRSVRQPFLLADWPMTRVSSEDRFTTVGSWRGPFGPIEYAGKTYGLKAHEFRKFIALPRHVTQTLEIALDIHAGDQKDLAALREYGWIAVDPRQNASDPTAFRHYVQESGAEFSVAQGVYVHTGSGWFSDRTVHYLASGKPALVQDTGFSRNYPVGEGLLAFSTFEEAVAGAREIARDYPSHCRAARALAETYFESNLVLGKLLDEVGI